MRTHFLFLGIALVSPVAVATPNTPATATGLASYYGEEYRGRTMANGAPFDPDALTAASWDFPLGSRVLVVHGACSVLVIITDRGPARRLYRQGRVVDLSAAAFAQLAPLRDGLIEVTVTLAQKTTLSVSGE